MASEVDLHVSATTELHDAIVAIGDYAVGDDADSKNRTRLILTGYLAEQARASACSTPPPSTSPGSPPAGKLDAKPHPLQQNHGT